MARHDPGDVAIAALALNVALLKHLEMKGWIRSAEAIFAEAAATLEDSPNERQALAVLNEFAKSV